LVGLSRRPGDHKGIAQGVFCSQWSRTLEWYRIARVVIRHLLLLLLDCCISWASHVHEEPPRCLQNGQVIVLYEPQLLVCLDLWSRIESQFCTTFSAVCTHHFSSSSVHSLANSNLASNARARFSHITKCAACWQEQPGELRESYAPPPIFRQRARQCTSGPEISGQAGLLLLLLGLVDHRSPSAHSDSTA
jgi:hypothetical protein